MQWLSLPLSSILTHITHLLLASMYSPLLISLIVLISKLALTSSLSFSTDDLNPNPLLFDTVEPSSFLAEEGNEILTTNAIPVTSCAAAVSDDSSRTNEASNLFSRDDDGVAQCLPPVNIGADALQLFEDPLNLLENNIILPLKKDETSDDPPPPNDSFSPRYPGILPNGVEGHLSDEEYEDLGFYPYTAPVRIEGVDDVSCKKWTADLGNFELELCCDDTYASIEAIGEAFKSRLRQVDARTIQNQDVEVIFPAWGLRRLHSILRRLPYQPPLQR